MKLFRYSKHITGWWPPSSLSTKIKLQEKIVKEQVLLSEMHFASLNLLKIFFLDSFFAFHERYVQIVIWTERFWIPE